MDSLDKNAVSPYRWRYLCAGVTIFMGFGLYCSGLSARHPATSIVMTGVGILIAAFFFSAYLGVKYLIQRNQGESWQPLYSDEPIDTSGPRPIPELSWYSVALSVFGGFIFAVLIAAIIHGFKYKADEHANTWGMATGGVVPVVLLFFYWFNDPSSVFQLYGILTYIVGWTLAICESGGNAIDACGMAILGMGMIFLFFVATRLAHRFDLNFGLIFALTSVFTTGAFGILFAIIGAAMGNSFTDRFWGLALLGGVLIGTAQILTVLAVRDTLVGNVGASLGLSSSIVGVMCLAYPWDTPTFPKVVSTYLMNIGWGIVVAGEVIFLGGVAWYRKYYPMQVEQY